MIRANLPLAVLVTVGVIAAPAGAWEWNPFRSKSKEQAAQRAGRPVRQASANVPVAAESLKLTQEAGPWLILATTFSGEGAEEQATDLCLELRQTLRLPTYLHEMTFEMNDGDEPIGRGVDRYGAPLKMAYKNGGKRREVAVLVGAYPAVDDTIAERDLQTIKSIEPQALLPDANGHTTQNFAGYRQLTAGASKDRSGNGPMRTAFLTRNPILPEEYFVPKGVDKYVEKINKGLEHSALDIEGRYAVKVATFRGRGTLLGAGKGRVSSSKVRRKKDQDDPLLEALEQAHFLCQEMRRQGWEAYEFHDRTESCVMVGSFDAVKNAAGEPKAEVVDIIRTFGAKFNTPQMPLASQKLKAGEAQRADLKGKQIRQSFNNLFSSEVGQVAGGMKPKFAHVKMSDNPREPLKAVPFDIHPHVVEVPKRSISSGFAWGRR